jgi:hypothetical protein
VCRVGEKGGMMQGGSAAAAPGIAGVVARDFRRATDLDDGGR